MDIVDKQILDCVEQTIITQRTLEEWVECVCKRVGDFKEKLFTDQEIRKMKSLLKECESRLGRLVEAIASGDSLFSSLKDKIREEEERKVEIEDDLQFAKSLDNVEFTQPDKESIRKAVENLCDILEAGDDLKVKNLIDEIIEKITVSTDGVFTIYYNKRAIAKNLTLPKVFKYDADDKRCESVVLKKSDPVVRLVEVTVPRLFSGYAGKKLNERLWNLENYNVFWMVRWRLSKNTYSNGPLLIFYARE